MPDFFGRKQLGRAATGGRFYAMPVERVEAGAVYFPVESSPLFGVAEYPVDAGHLGAFATAGTFVFDKPVDWFDLTGRKVFCRPSTGKIVNQDRKGDVLIGYQVVADVPDDKLGVFLTQGQLSVSIIVTSTADTGAGSLRQAIADANDGDVILFDSTVFPVGTTTSILLSSTLNVPKNIEIDGDGRVVLDGQNAIRVCTPTASSGKAARLKGLIIKNGAYSNGAGVLLQYGEPILTDCIIEDCVASTNAGGIYAIGAVNATLNNCTITGCTATNGGGIYSRDASAITLRDCHFDASSTVYIANTSALIITVGITTIAAATIGAATITIADGAALAVTTSATIGAATFTSPGRGYLATASGIDLSAATLNNVVACAYGAGIESFNIDADGASWTAQDLTTPILIETRNDTGGWDTLTTQATGGEYPAAFEVGTTARAFDGVTFLRAEISEYWQATAWAAATNGAGTSSGGESATDSWSVEPVTITPNLNEG